MLELGGGTKTCRASELHVVSVGPELRGQTAGENAVDQNLCGSNPEH